MSVFKLCQKILLRNGLSLSIYLIIFLVMSLIIIGSGDSGGQVQRQQFRVPMAITNSETTPLLNGLRKELEKTARITDLPENDRLKRDALFFGRVSYILNIPRGFSQGFMRGEMPSLTVDSRPDERYSRYVDMAIEQYFRLANLYRSQLADMDEKELVRMVSQNLEKQAKVVLHQSPSVIRSMPYARAYFNFMSYSLFNLLIVGIVALMLVFNQREIRLRNSCSPISLRKLNGQLFLAGLVYSLFCWAMMSLLCLLVQGDPLPAVNLTLFLINGLVFTFWAAAASFAIGQMTENREAVSGLATVVTLASSFLGGAFVPQEFLGDGLLKFAQYLPTYWFVRANSQITGIGSFRFSETAPLLGSMAMQLLFALTFISVALVVSRKKRQLV